MRSEDLAVFLKRLSPDAAEAERRYVHLRNNKLVGFFNMRGVSDAEGAAAETLDRAAEKIGAGADVPDVEKYCIGIARNVAREYWRHERREDTVFRLFIGSLADDSAEEVERIEHVLKPCFESLKDKEQKLLVAYCLTPEELPRAEHRRRLADKLGITMQALRIQVSRLRDKLEDCVKGHMENR